MVGEKVVSAEMWSTPSGSAHLVMPREMMDIPVVAPSTTKPSSKKRAAAGVSIDELATSRRKGKRRVGGAWGAGVARALLRRHDGVGEGQRLQTGEGR